MHRSLQGLNAGSHLEAVRCSWKDKTLDIRQPLQKQMMRLTKTGPESVAFAAEDSENLLGDSSRL